jgi:hypothetical protein
LIEPLLDENDLHEVTGRSVSSIQKDRLDGTGCPFVRIGRLIRYRPEDVRNYLASLPSFTNTSAATVAETKRPHQHRSRGRGSAPRS